MEVDESREFPATNTGAKPEPDGTGWSLPAGGPFLRTIEVAGVEAKAVVVCLGGSSTAMGWPQYTAALLPADARIAVVNRGIAGNRIRLDAPQPTPSWGRAGLSRFDEDVLGTGPHAEAGETRPSPGHQSPCVQVGLEPCPRTGCVLHAHERITRAVSQPQGRITRPMPCLRRL